MMEHFGHFHVNLEAGRADLFQMVARFLEEASRCGL